MAHILELLSEQRCFGGFGAKTQLRGVRDTPSHTTRYPHFAGDLPPNLRVA